MTRQTRAAVAPGPPRPDPSSPENSAAGRQDRLDLLFTDVVLPGGATGRELADAARAKAPELRVLFTTGYARNAIVHNGRLDPDVEMIGKPFTFAELAARVRDALDAPHRPGEATRR